MHTGNIWCCSYNIKWSQNIFQETQSKWLIVWVLIFSIQSRLFLNQYWNVSSKYYQFLLNFSWTFLLGQLWQLLRSKLVFPPNGRRISKWIQCHYLVCCCCCCSWGIGILLICSKIHRFELQRANRNNIWWQLNQMTEKCGLLVEELRLRSFFYSPSHPKELMNSYWN